MSASAIDDKITSFDQTNAKDREQNIMLSINNKMRLMCALGNAQNSMVAFITGIKLHTQIL